MNRRASRAHPPYRAAQSPPQCLRLSIPVGNVVQATGLAIGVVLLSIASHTGTATTVRTAAMLLGVVTIYLCCHSVAHWAVGRLVGIRFRAYEIGGPRHPENYPPGLDRLMREIPLFAVVTEQASVREAAPLGKAAMFAAGQTSTVVCTLLAAGYAWRTHIPGGDLLFAFLVGGSLAMVMVTAGLPHGDYARAARALRAPRRPITDAPAVASKASPRNIRRRDGSS
jgi:hypothetical protein